MNNTILTFINLLEGYKTAIKNLHWNSKNLSQHEKCDDIADAIADFQDVVSEVEQSISGNLSFNKLKGAEYHITNIQKFLKDVIKNTTKFYKELESMGDNYIGLHSECESFLTKFQRFSYLINFTLKEDFKKEYAKKINEAFETEDGILNDAIEALDMSDGQIDFYEWSAAYQDEDEQYLLNVWNKACDEVGFSQLKENCNKEMNNMTLNEMDSDKYGYIKGYHAAQPRYNQKENSVPNKAKHDRMVSMAGDAHWKNVQNAGLGSKEAIEMDNKYKKGYEAGYQRGMKSESVKLTENELMNVMNEAITKVMTKFINEMDENCQSEVEVQGGMYNDKELDYTHFAVNKITNLIVDGWGYAGYDSEELKQFKNDYFNVDLKENGFNPKMYKILSFKGCQKQGLDPNNKQIWSNTGVYPLAQEVQMNKQGQNPYEAAQQEHPDWFDEN